MVVRCARVAALRCVCVCVCVCVRARACVCAALSPLPPICSYRNEKSSWRAGRGAELRQLATVSGFGRDVGWRQAQGALRLCARSLRPAAATGCAHEAKDTAATGAVQEDEHWRSRFLLCAASLPLALSLVERADRQQREMEDNDAEGDADAAGSEHGSDSSESVDFDAIKAPSDAEEASQMAAGREREWRISAASLDAVGALAEYAEQELLCGWQLQRPGALPAHSKSSNDFRAALRWAIGQFSARRTFPSPTHFLIQTS